MAAPSARSLHNEKSPLTESIEAMKEAYSFESHVKLKGDSLVDYVPAKLSSIRVFCAVQATILTNPVLFVEQCLITLIFASSAAPVYYFFSQDVAENAQGKDQSVRRWINSQEGKMRAFAMIMTNLAAFLLSFYTAICVARWWAMRTGGIGGIKAATVDLELLLHQNVTKEEKVLDCVRRYGRVSLMLIFLWRQMQTGELKEYFVSRDMLTPDEADQLLTWNKNKICLHETIWAWQAGIVAMLQKEGKIKSDSMYTLLLKRCTHGRAAVQLVHTHLAVRVPMQYIHLLGLLVKMHNFVLAVICGCLFGAALRKFDWIICVQLFARTLILPFLFNAILLINAELADPFDGGETDFPGPVYQEGLNNDCKAVVHASENLPDWLAARASAI